MDGGKEEMISERGRSFCGGRLRESFHRFSQSNLDFKFEPGSPPPPLPQKPVKENELPGVPSQMLQTYVSYMENLLTSNESGSNDPLLCKELFDVQIEEGIIPSNSEENPNSKAVTRQVAIMYTTEAKDVVKTLVEMLNMEKTISSPNLVNTNFSETQKSSSAPTTMTKRDSNLLNQQSNSLTNLFTPSQFCLVERNEVSKLERLISPEEYILAIVLNWETPEKMSFILKRSNIKAQAQPSPVRIRQTRHMVAREQLLQKKNQEKSI